MLQEVLNEQLPKRFRRGTHRIANPAETVERVRPLAAQMGITRLGNITGLDRIGIPVAIAVRPNSRSVSVAQGKGLDLPQAMASALMEACETFHAEEVGALRGAAYQDLVRGANVVDPATLSPALANSILPSPSSGSKDTICCAAKLAGFPPRSSTPITYSRSRTPISSPARTGSPRAITRSRRSTRHFTNWWSAMRSPFGWRNRCADGPRAP